MRPKIIQDLYAEDGTLKHDELQRLTPGTKEFAILDETIRTWRRVATNLLLFMHLNPAYHADARIENGERPDHDLPGLGRHPLERLRSFLALSARDQRFILIDDGAMLDLVEGYKAARGAALRYPEHLPPDWKTRATSENDWEEELQRDLDGLTSARRGATPLRPVTAARPPGKRIPDIL